MWNNLKQSRACHACNEWVLHMCYTFTGCAHRKWCAGSCNECLQLEILYSMLSNCFVVLPQSSTSHGSVTIVEVNVQTMHTAKQDLIECANLPISSCNVWAMYIFLNNIWYLRTCAVFSVCVRKKRLDLRVLSVCHSHRKRPRILLQPYVKWLFSHVCFPFAVAPTGIQDHPIVHICVYLCLFAREIRWFSE